MKRGIPILLFISALALNIMFMFISQCKDDKIQYLQHENNAIRNSLVNHLDSCHSDSIHNKCFKIGK